MSFELDDTLTFEETNQEVTDTDTNTFDEKAWEAHGKELGEQHAEALNVNLRKLDWCRWEIGEWLIAGAAHYGESWGAEVICGHRIELPDVYLIAENITGLKRNTLKDLSSTARRIPEAVRNPACSWSHHRALRNALPKADENTLKQWLQRVVDEKLTVAKLQRAIKFPKGAPIKEKSFRVTVPLNVWETLKDFADQYPISVQKEASNWLIEWAAERESSREIARVVTEARRYETRVKQGKRLQRGYPVGTIVKPFGS